MRSALTSAAGLDLSKPLALRPPAKTPDGLQALIDREGAQACDIHQVLAVAQHVGGRKVSQLCFLTLNGRKPLEEQADVVAIRAHGQRRQTAIGQGGSELRLPVLPWGTPPASYSTHC